MNVPKDILSVLVNLATILDHGLHLPTDGGLHEYLLKTKHKNSFFQNLLVPLVLFKQFNRKKQ